MSTSDASRMDAENQSLSARFKVWLWRNQIAWIVVAAIVLVAVMKFRQVDAPHTAKAAAPTATTTAQSAHADGGVPGPAPLQHDIMATVNGKDITRTVLIDACVERYGKEVLESLVNKRLILNHCEKRQIAITNEDIAGEIDRMAKRFNLSREQWFDLLERERGISPQEYARDIVWPTLALRKLAAAQVQPTAEEIDRAMERDFGASVNARLIAVGSRQLATELHAKLQADPELFPRLAIEHSIDINSASVGGLIQPIRRHLGDTTIEQAAFSLKPGEISQVLPVAGQFVILRCESHEPPRQINRAEVEKQLVEKITDEKLREESHKLFGQLQKSATLVNVYNNPELRQTMPGVVATVNGDRITLRELGEECLVRHGSEVLEGEISRVLLEQSLAKANVTITDADLQAEVRHAAELAGIVDENGNADMAKWTETITREQGIDHARYIRDAVWPSAALKKLTASTVQVTDEDIHKGFAANYGERVRCRAIVLGTMRRAQEVWDKARRNPSIEYFGDLAEEYSIEPTSKNLRGEVPPIQRYSGQPQLEEAAFRLQAGELSGIIQVGDKFIILRCEGRTDPVKVNEAEVRDILARDIYEKKLRIAMSEKFESLRDESRIDNYLAGTSSTPSERTAKRQDGLLQDSAVRPTAGVAR